MRTIVPGILAGVSLLGGCATSSPPPTDAGIPIAAIDRARCASATVAVDTDFPAGALASCSVSGENIDVTISPEDAPPINCSAWYAFRITPAAPADLRINLNYTACGHRYWPKISRDGVTWTYLEQDQVEIDEFSGRLRARIRLDTDGRPFFLAGQEIVVPATYDAWLDQMAGQADATRFLLGQSAEGREISALTIADPGSTQRETVVLVGRQHPPEVTGALAMLPFVETLLGDDELARSYRARFKTVVVPMLNPDGVVHGHWRHNTGGIDLNRDWGPFSQPETRLMRNLLEAIDADPDQRLRLFIDFHSTRYDTIYTLTDEQVTDPVGYKDAWLADYAKRLPGYDVRIEPGHNPDRPVSKAWVFNRFGVPTATYEIGDETDRALIRKLGVAAAQSMMKTLLETEPE